MAKRKRAIPQYGTVTLNGIDYYRTRVQNTDGKLVALYARTPEELYDKELGAIEQIDNDTFCRKSPTVADYCEKWLLMQSVHVRATTLIDYTSKVRRHIIKELGQMRMADVTLDDIQLALVPVSEKSASVYKSVVILYKSIFRAAKESKIIDTNPTIYLTAKGGGVPQKDKAALTDEQAARLLDAIQGLPPYVFVLLESMQDGVLYSNILLKLYLKSLKHGGRLQLDEDIPYTAQMIATITRQQIGTVERALQIFLKLGLVEVLDSGTFYMSNIELLIGQSSTEAERKRAARLQNKALSAPRTNGGHLSDIRPPEIEIELEKEIEIKREIEKGHPAHAYGRYQNVFLTDGELADLQASFPTVWGQYIEKLSEYMASTGKRYQSHAATIRRWAGEDAKKTITPSRNRDYSVKEDETV